jgi:uncharacterized protein (DUF58 family)
MWIFLLLMGIFILWLIQKFLFTHYWKKGLSVFVQFQDSYIFEEDTSTLKETIVNDKMLPLSALSIRFAMSKNLSFLKDSKENSGVSDQNYKRDLFSFLFHQQITRTLDFQGKRRGCYEISSIDVSAYDFFFQGNYYMSFPQETRLYIYPKPIDIRKITLLSEAITGTILSQNRLFADPFEFSGIREYRKEDPLHHMNWKASARMQKLMVNNFDATTNYSITILLDIEDPYILKNAALTEESIRIAASLSAFLLQKKIPLRLLCNGRGITESISTGKSCMSEIYQALACVQSSDLCCSIHSLIEQECQLAHTGETYVFISKNHTPELVSSLYRLQHTRNALLWVLPTYDYKMSEKFEDSQLSILHWEVKS